MCVLTSTLLSIGTNTAKIANRTHTPLVLGSFPTNLMQQGKMCVCKKFITFIYGVSLSLSLFLSFTQLLVVSHVEGREKIVMHMSKIGGGGAQ